MAVSLDPDGTKVSGYSERKCTQKKEEGKIPGIRLEKGGIPA